MSCSNNVVIIERKKDKDNLVIATMPIRYEKAILQEKNVKAVKNEDITITPDFGYDGLSKVNVSIQNINRIDITQIGYPNDVNERFNDYYYRGMEYADIVKYEWSENTYDMSNMFRGDANMIFFPIVNLDKVENINNVFSFSSIEYFPNFPNNGFPKKSHSIFAYCYNLKEVGDLGTITTMINAFIGDSILTRIGNIDVKECTDFDKAFSGCGLLEEVKVLNYREGNLSFTEQPYLSIMSINSIIENALGAEQGAKQRTLTLNAYAKDRWMDGTLNPYFTEYAIMASNKLITIA